MGDRCVFQPINIFQSLTASVGSSCIKEDWYILRYTASKTSVSTLQVPETKIVEFANSVDLDEMAQNEPPHLDLPVCPLVFDFSVGYSLDLTIFENLQMKILTYAFW